MKKIMNIFVLVAAAAMTLVSCQKNEMDAPAAKKELHFTIKANAPQTKTVISDNGDKTYTPSWEKGDEIGIYFTEPAKDAKADATFANINENGPIAEFDGTAAAPEEGVLYAFYPESAINKAYDDGTIRLDLSTSQKPTSTSFDPACDILVAQPCEYLSDGETVVIDDLHFARIMSVLRINLNSTFADVKDEVVESVSFAVQDIDMAGNAKVDYKTGEIVGWNNGSVDRNVITASYTSEDFVTVAGENNSVYLVVAPVEIPAGKEITFTIETQNYTITKTVAAPAMEFNAGKVEVINLTILAENCDEKIDQTETRVWVEGFDGETVNKTQTSAKNSGAMGTGVSDDLTYAYSADNCNVRINSNGQTSTNPFLYINAANSSFTASKIKIANENNLSISAKVKGNGLKLTVEYKESSATTWTNAGVINGGSSYVENEVIFAVANTATSIDIRLTGSGVMYVDDIVLASTDVSVPVVTLTSIAVTGQKTTFTVGDTFEFGGTVTATYSNGTTAQVTPTSVSTPEMTEGEHTVTVTYVEEDITKTVEYTIQVNPASTGDVPSKGTILWQETWADAGATSTTFAQNTAISAYNYAGRTGYEANATSVTYTADASNNVRITKSSGGNCTSGHLWFNKSAAGELKTSAINLYGATSLTFSHSQGTSGSSCQTLYSVNGGSTWTSLGTQSGAIATKTYTFTVPDGTESIMIKLVHDSSNLKNTRVDNLVLKVN